MRPTGVVQLNHLPLQEIHFNCHEPVTNMLRYYTYRIAPRANATVVW